MLSIIVACSAAARGEAARGGWYEDAVVGIHYPGQHGTTRALSKIADIQMVCQLSPQPSPAAPTHCERTRDLVLGSIQLLRL